MQERLPFRRNHTSFYIYHHRMHTCWSGRCNQDVICHFIHKIYTRLDLEGGFVALGVVIWVCRRGWICGDEGEVRWGRWERGREHCRRSLFVSLFFPCSYPFILVLNLESICSFFSSGFVFLFFFRVCFLASFYPRFPAIRTYIHITHSLLFSFSYLNLISLPANRRMTHHHNLPFVIDITI
jgi:hypothetical protein